MRNRTSPCNAFGPAHCELRQQELLEALVAYCRVSLRKAAGEKAVADLPQSIGLDADHLFCLPLGFYTTPTEVRQYLENLGFDREEIDASRAVRDSRLAGRLIVPWRDQWGRIRTIVADMPGSSTNDRAPRLYRRDADFDEPFGLDVALQASSGGRDHLILVGDVWDVLYFRASGVSNVASLGSPRKTPTSRHWELLADCGVRAVTLALADNEVGRARTLEAIYQAGGAKRAPRIFALPAGVLGCSRTPASFTRLQGLDDFQRILQQRCHCYRYVAEAIVRKHKPQPTWTDAGLMETLAEAVEFDTRFYNPEVAWQLESFFWPTIIEATGVEQDAVQMLLARHCYSPVLRHAQPAHEYWGLTRQLQFYLQEGAHADFRALVRATAEGFRENTDWTRPCVTQAATLPILSISEIEHTENFDKPSEEDVSGTSVEEEDLAEAPEGDCLPEEIDCEPEGTDSDCKEPEQIDEPPSTEPVDIHDLAYRIWEDKGRREGIDRECWLEAEERLRSFQIDVVPGKSTSCDEHRSAA